MNDITVEKKTCRAELRRRRALLADGEREMLDNMLCKRILELREYRDARTVLAYYPVKNEPSLLAVVSRAIEDGKKVAFPVSNRENFTLRFGIVDSLCELVEGEYSIPEPPESAREPNEAELAAAICIVPALGYDRDGFRIGYGRGYYDRFLSCFGGVSVGAVYADFLLDVLPRESTDRAVDIIVSESEEIFFNGREREKEKIEY